MANQEKFVRCAASAVIAGAALLVATGFGGCGNGPSGATFGAGGGTNNGGNGSGTAGNMLIVPGQGGGVSTDGSAPSAPHPCVNLECQQTSCTLGDCHQMACPSGGKTTVHGTVYDPAGKVPLYNVVVYVPNGDVPKITDGATCDRCDSHVIAPVTSTLTDTHGNFVLEDVPVGSNIPLVMQVGKWRRQIKIPTVTACGDTPLTDKTQTRLPADKTEGDIPLIAITTGGADSMECLPIRMGLKDSEFSTEAGTGRIHLYSGLTSDKNKPPTKKLSTALGGATLTPATTVWADVDHLKKYDIVILSCEGATFPEEKPATARQAMYDYESLGGRVFASHWHHIWFSGGPDPVPQIGMWNPKTNPADPPKSIVGTIDTSFPKGQAMADWLVNVGASTTVGQMQILDGRDNIESVDPNLARQWISIQAPANGGTAAHTTIEYLSYNAPLKAPEAMQCGRAVYNDLHVSSTGNDQFGQPFPEGCEKRDLTAQEKAVEFMLFDLSSCIQDDTKPPEPPSVVR